MIRRLFVLWSAGIALAAVASPVEMPARPALPALQRAPERFIAPTLAPALSITLTTPSEKELASEAPARPGPVRVGTVRALAQAAAVSAWVPVPGGHVAKVRAA